MEGQHLFTFVNVLFTCLLASCLITCLQGQGHIEEDDPERVVKARKGTLNKSSNGMERPQQAKIIRKPDDTSAYSYFSSLPVHIPAPSVDVLLQQPTKYRTGLDRHCEQGGYLLELDICLTPLQMDLFESLPFKQEAAADPARLKRVKRQVTSHGLSLWQDGVIPYVLNASFSVGDLKVILEAMQEWEVDTCVRFRPASRQDRDFLVITDGLRCSTNIGRIGGAQVMTLASACRLKSVLVHELGHVIGLIHEHQRHDRDNYVRVILQNIRNMYQERFQFTRLLTSSLTEKTVEYDYTSIMHYGKNYFSRSPDLVTLLTLDRRFHDVIGRASKPSFRDTETVNLLYRCAKNTDVQNILAENTCEFLRRSGECQGSTQNTVKLLCAKSCQTNKSLIILNSVQTILSLRHSERKNRYPARNTNTVSRPNLPKPSNRNNLQNSVIHSQLNSRNLVQNSALLISSIHNYQRQEHPTYRQSELPSTVLREYQQTSKTETGSFSRLNSAHTGSYTGRAHKIYPRPPNINIHQAQALRRKENNVKNTEPNYFTFQTNGVVPRSNSPSELHNIGKGATVQPDTFDYRVVITRLDKSKNSLKQFGNKIKSP